MITAEIILEIAPRARHAKAYAKAMQEHCPGYHINTGLREAHFLAQLAHESGGFIYDHELWGPTKAQKGYEGRADLGNTQKGDGRRYAGRGIIQLTGRANYARFGKALGLPLEDKPELAAHPDVAVLIACAYWKDRKLNGYADIDDIVTITKRTNGGLNGLADRKKYLVKAKKALGVREP